MVRNTHPGPAVFSYGKDAENFVEWAGAGDRNGGDVQAVPAALLNHPQFRKSMVAGVYVVESGEDLAEQVEAAHRAEYQDRVQQQRDASVATIDQEPDNDFVVLSCIGFANKNSYKACGADVSVRSKDRFEKAPLCPEHKSQEKDFVPSGTGRLVGNQSEVVWKKVTVADRVRQAQPKE